MLTLDDAKKVYRGLYSGYRKEVASRLQFNKKNPKLLENADVITHVYGYKVENNTEIPLLHYSTVDSQTQFLLSPYLNYAESVMSSLIENTQYIFLIMSTNWCGVSRHFKHVHTLLQSDPPRCHTLSITIPLYIEKECSDYHKFRWHYQPNLYPSIVYADHTRMEKIERDYTAIEISKTQFSSLLFDSSRCIHYIDNTPHLYLWFVCDGVILKGDRQSNINGVQVGLHGSI
jgi:hypothetical protein